jgi:hypothetical protein
MSTASQESASVAHTHTFTSNDSNTILVRRLIKLRADDTSSNLECRSTVRLSLVGSQVLDALEALHPKRQSTSTSRATVKVVASILDDESKVEGSS